MTAVETLKLRAEKLAQQMHISEARAYEYVIETSPDLYRQAELERADSGIAGTSGSLEYARQARRRGLLRGQR